MLHISHMHSLPILAPLLLLYFFCLIAIPTPIFDRSHKVICSSVCEWVIAFCKTKHRHTLFRCLQKLQNAKHMRYEMAVWERHVPSEYPGFKTYLLTPMPSYALQHGGVMMWQMGTLASPTHNRMTPYGVRVRYCILHVKNSYCWKSGLNYQFNVRLYGCEITGSQMVPYEKCDVVKHFTHKHGHWEKHVAVSCLNIRVVWFIRSTKRVAYARLCYHMRIRYEQQSSPSWPQQYVQCIMCLQTHSIASAEFGNVPVD